jgi:hypothetical protein
LLNKNEAGKKGRKKEEKKKKRKRENTYLEVEQVLAVLDRRMDPAGHGMAETGLLWP